MHVWFSSVLESGKNCQTNPFWHFFSISFTSTHWIIQSFSLVPSDVTAHGEEVVSLSCATAVHPQRIELQVVSICGWKEIPAWSTQPYAQPQFQPFCLLSQCTVQPWLARVQSVNCSSLPSAGHYTCLRELGQSAGKRNCPNFTSSKRGFKYIRLLQRFQGEIHLLCYIHFVISHFIITMSECSRNWKKFHLVVYILLLFFWRAAKISKFQMLITEI